MTRRQEAPGSFSSGHLVTSAGARVVEPHEIHSWGRIVFVVVPGAFQGGINRRIRPARTRRWVWEFLVMRAVRPQTGNRPEGGTTDSFQHAARQHGSKEKDGWAETLVRQAHPPRISWQIRNPQLCR